jgi:hypothetical protein
MVRGELLLLVRVTVEATTGDEPCVFQDEEAL